MLTFSNIFCSTLCWGHVIFEYILYAVYFLTLLSPLNDASVDIVDDKGSFQFSLEGEFTSPLSVHVTLATSTESESPCFAQLKLHNC